MVKRNTPGVKFNFKLEKRKSGFPGFFINGEELSIPESVKSGFK